MMMMIRMTSMTRILSKFNCPSNYTQEHQLPIRNYHILIKKIGIPWFGGTTKLSSQMDVDSRSIESCANINRAWNELQNLEIQKPNQSQRLMMRESVRLWRSPKSRRGGRSRRRGEWGGRGACSSPSWGRRTAGRLRRRGPRRPRRRRRRGSWRRRRPLFWSERKKDRRWPVKRLYSQSPPNSFQLDNEKGPTSTHFSSPFFFFLIYPTHKKIQIQK